MDIQTINAGWITVYSAAGITVGTGVEVQNKNSNLITIQESANQPAAQD